MIVSMTGYAAVAAELPGVSLSVELRSVSHRASIYRSLPDELRGLGRRCVSESPPNRGGQGRMPHRVDRAAPGAAALAVDAARVDHLAIAAAVIQQHAAGARRCRSMKSCAGPVCSLDHRSTELAARVHELLGTACAISLLRERAKVPRPRRCRRLRIAIEAQIVRVRLHFGGPCGVSEKPGARRGTPASIPTRDRLKQELALATKIDEAYRASARMLPKSAACSPRAAAPASDLTF
jgi:hypothetical protein